MDQPDSSTTSVKRCSTCKETKPVDQFSKKTRMKDGLNGQCKECTSRSFANYYKSNREKQLSRAKTYREEHPLSKEESSKRRKKYWDSHRAEIAERRKAAYEEREELRKQNRERARRWYYENKDRQSALAKNYYKKNSEQIKKRVRENENNNKERTRALGRVKTNRRRARLATTNTPYTRHDIAALLKAQKSKCVYCKCDIRNNYHIDHIIPVAKGGTNEATNIQLLCPKCNMAKSAKLPHEFAQEIGMLL